MSQSGLYQLLTSNRTRTYLEQACAHSIASGRKELDVEAVLGERAHGRLLIIIANADEGRFRGLDETYQLLVAAAVTRRHTVYLIHNDEALRFTSAA